MHINQLINIFLLYYISLYHIVEMAEQFKPTLQKLDTLIQKLEVSTGSPHQPSPAEKLSQQTQPKNDNNTPNQTSHETKKQQANKQEETKKEQKPVQESKKEDNKPQTKKQEKPAQKKDTKPAQKKKEEELPEGTIEDFIQIDIRVGQIKQCWKHAESQNLYCQKIDIGEENIRQIGSGLQKFVPIDQMTGLVMVMANLKPRKLAGFMSNGMVMANSNDDHTQIFLAVPKGAKVGERVVLQGFEDKFNQQKQPELNPKKKILQKCIGKFSTDAEGAAMWNGSKLKTSGGYIICPIPNAHLS